MKKSRLGKCVSILFSRTTLSLDLFTFFPKCSKMYVRANLWNGYIFKSKTFYFLCNFFFLQFEISHSFGGVMRYEMKDGVVKYS